MKRLLSTVALAGALLAGTLPAAASSVGPATDPYTKWGWVTVRDLSAGPHLPAAVDNGNSRGKQNSYQKLGNGTFAVVFAGLADPGGVALVTAMNAAGTFCQVRQWGPDHGSEVVYVWCFGANGNAAASKFTVSFLATNSDAGPMGYMFIGDPSHSHPVAPPYTYNSGGGTNGVQTPAVGRYELTLPGIGSTHGNVQVSAYGGDPQYRGTCALTGSVGDGSGQHIYVRCYDVAGALHDIPFSVIFTLHEGLKGHGRSAVAYLTADMPHAASYVPALTYRYSSAGMPPGITRTSAGRYKVNLPGMPAGGGVIVTAYDQHVRCNITSIQTVTPQHIGVACWKIANGNPIDSQFSLSYVN